MYIEVTWIYYLRLFSSSLFILDKKSGASERRFEFVLRRVSIIECLVVLLRILEQQMEG